MAIAEAQPRARLEMTEESEQPMTEDEMQWHRWVGRVRQSLREQTPEALGAPAKVFSVPKTLLDTKPESYTPQFFSLGPYHQARPELMDMERFKLAGAKRVEMSFTDDRNMDHLMGCFLDDDVLHKIRSTYHRTLNQNPTTLACMMAIDACFLLDFIETYPRQETTGVLYSSANWAKAIVRDVMMLENQIPLFVLRKALELRHDTRREAAKALHTIADRFVKAVSPIKITRNKPIRDVAKRAHLLEVLYLFLVPDATLVDANNGGEQEPEPPAEEELVDDNEVSGKPSLQDQGYDTVKQAVTKVCSLNIVKKKMARKAPALAALVPVCGKLGDKVVQSMDLEAQPQLKGTDQLQGDAPRADEICVPSVEQLARCGVRFEPTTEGIARIKFDPATATLRLPKVVLDENTEVVLRNLVAYEAVAVQGKLVLARYTELMNGIIDTSKDVKILQRSGVVKSEVNHKKKSKDAADMWNAMARATRRSKVPQIDDAIADLNAHRDRSPAGRVQKLLKYVFRSWKMLTLLASVGLLVMTGLQTFCSAYPCGNRWFDVGVVPGADDPAR